MKWWILRNKSLGRPSIDDLEFGKPSLIKRLTNLFRLLEDMYKNCFFLLLVITITSIIVFSNLKVTANNLPSSNNFVDWYYYIIVFIPVKIVLFPAKYILNNGLTNFSNLDFVIGLLFIIFLFTLLVYIYNLIMDFILHRLFGRPYYVFWYSLYNIFTLVVFVVPGTLNIVVKWLFSI